MEDGERARQFLEKFVNIKLSLFVDSSALCRFLREDWNKDKHKYPSIPSDTMYKFESILIELANILEGEHASKYLPLIGDMRKIKRFINALLLMQIDKTPFPRTDFHRQDLINLMLLHLIYPGIFRRIYDEETEGRSGIFSTKSTYENNSSEYTNDNAFKEFVDACPALGGFLVAQLFEINSLEFGAYGSVEESVSASRACFNDDPRRNLENFLKLIVRFIIPEPRVTFKLYQDAVAKVISGISVEEVLSGSDFILDQDEHTHDEFWRILVSQSYEFNATVAEDSIKTLVQYLPKYSTVDTNDRALRRRSIYNLIRLLDRAGWGRTDGKRHRNSSENIIEIAHRIYGENKYKGQGLIDQLAEVDRGVLGLNDLILFRLQCSADRQGQVYNLHNALLLYDDNKAETTGPVNALAIAGMRTISQRVFALFKSRYIDMKHNIFDDIEALSNAELLGTSPIESVTDEFEGALDSIEATRSVIKTFNVYQLVNRQAGTGSGVGCGYYDLDGTADEGEIAALMNDYLFEICFNSEIKEQNVEYFLDYCLCKFISGFWSGSNEEGYHPTPQSLAAELDTSKLVDYWAKNGKVIKERDFVTSEKRVVTYNYVATYEEDLVGVFDVLDQMLSESEAENINQTDERSE